LELEQVDRYVSRSRSQAIYHAARAEVEQLLGAVDGDGGDGEESHGQLVMDWDTLYADKGFDALGFATVSREEDAESAPIEDRAATVYRFGRRLSGITFSPGGDLSMVLYDKVLQGRLSGKRHMEPLWAAAGWQPGIAVTRHEARLRRPAVRELGLVGEARSCLDDPWECLTYLTGIFAAVVGHADAEQCPGAVDVAWIRRVVPDAGDTNRSRWSTDPVWRVVQRASFADAPAAVRRLIRRRQRGTDVAVLDRGQFGYLVSRVALQHVDGGHWTLSRALGEALPALEVLEAKKTQAGQDFGELVRERRRQRGFFVPIADKVLPFRPATTGDETTGSHDHERWKEGSADDAEAHRDSMHPGDKRSDEGQLRRAGADVRMVKTWEQLTDAERRGAKLRELQRLEQDYLRAVGRYTAACSP
jgi:hypothetical protein